MNSRKTQQEVDYLWENAQAIYWNSLAAKYESLYTNSWSVHEDKQTQEWLRLLIQGEVDSVLDLACGTGLAYNLLCGINKNISYTGVDISPEMIAICSNNISESMNLHIGPMHDLSGFNSETFDCVTCLYTSFSFTNKPLITLSEIYRVVRPQGKVFISALNRYGLWRLCSLQLSKEINYKTRGAEMIPLTTPANTFTNNELREMFVNAGFRDIEIYGQGLFSGIIQSKKICQMNHSLLRLIPHFCHTLNVKACK